MANPTGSRGDAAYARAQAAYQEHSYDDARGWVLEALAQDPQHAAARALLGRIDALARDLRIYHARPGPTNPDVSISSGQFAFQRRALPHHRHR